MAINNLPGVLKTLKTEEILLHAKLKGAGAAALTENDPFKMGSIVSSITRSSLGVFAITFTFKVPQTVCVFEPVIKSSTVGFKGRWSALDLAAGTGTLRIETEGGSQLPAWSGATAVAANTTGALAAAGTIVAVEITAGGVTGAGNLVFGAPANSRDVQVSYTAGVPTINTLAADAVTEVRYLQIATATATDPTTSEDIYIGFIVRNSGQH